MRLWDGFVEAAGGDADDAPTPETARVRAQLDRERRRRASRSCACTRSRAGSRRSRGPSATGLLERYGFDDGAGTAYFRIHATRDVEHAAEVRELIAELGADADEDRLVAAAESAFRANWRLLDGV